MLEEQIFFSCFRGSYGKARSYFKPRLAQRSVFIISIKYEIIVTICESGLINFINTLFMYYNYSFFLHPKLHG